MNMNKLLMNAPRGHKLLTKGIERRLPALGATDGVPLKDKIVGVKFFTPASNWTWYGIEYSPEERLFFGYVCGFEKELGYFSLDELEGLNAAVERDLYFEPTKLHNLENLE